MDSDYVWYTDLSKQFLERDYFLPRQTLDERVNIICNTAEGILKKPGFAKRLKENIKKGWYSLSSPIWSNFGADRGLPISCFGSYLSDNMGSIAYTHAEIMMMTKYGGGTSAYFGNLRGRGEDIKDNGKSSGAVHFMQIFDKLITVTSQGSNRRGNCATYLPIDHKDILEFLEIRKEGNPIQDLSTGVCIPDYWLQEMIDGDVNKRKVWAKVIESRCNTGYPYIFFTDNVNNNTVDVYKDKGMRINASNLCSEVFLPSSEEESFVCDLSSMNIFYYDQWKDTDAVEILTYFLDAVMTEFIEKAKKIRFMERAVRFAERHRALGIGWLGWHSYLQSNMIPFESMQAKYRNLEVAKNIKEKAYLASAKLAQEYGEPELLKGYGRRNTTLLAIAPTKSCTTSDTLFKDENYQNIDFFEFIRRGGLDLNEIIKQNNKKWLELENPVKIYTSDGIKECHRFYFNGFEEVFELSLSDNNSYKFTGNHKLKSTDGNWISVCEIEKGFVFNNGVKVVDKKSAGIKPTMDMEVPDVHYYVLSNGVHSHNSSFILGQVSEGTEPHRTNYYIKDLQKGKFTVKNKELVKLLQEKGLDKEEVWDSILKHGGSVQHLSCLNQCEKDVFKTFAEISQKEIIIQASQRQHHVDQGQSLNLVIHPSTSAKDINKLIIEAHALGIKSLYYQISISAAQQFSRDLLNSCQSCQS